MDMMIAVNDIAFALVVAYALYLFGIVVYRRYQYLSLGKPVAIDARSGMGGFVAQVFGQKKLFKDAKSGTMHFVMFYGFIILQFGALDLIAKGLTRGEHIPYPAYESFSFCQECVAILILIATGYAAYRRYGERLKRLKRGFKPSIVLLLIAGLMVCVLLDLSFERVWHHEAASWYGPISSLLASAFSGIGTTAAETCFYVFWWLHLCILLTFLIYVPQSKHFHLMVAPINVLLRRKHPPGRLRSLDLEDENAESFGVGQIEDFNRKQMLDFFACVECGRCTNVCPASNTGKPLSPMHLIVKMRDHLLEKGAAATHTKAYEPAYLLPQHDGSAHKMAAGGEDIDFPSDALVDIEPTLHWQKEAWALQEADVSALSLIGDVITEDEIWACTTCRNCEDQCPVDNEHVDKIIDLRRYLVLMEGSMPNEAKRAMQNIERQGNPWGLSRNERSHWTNGLDVPVPTVHENPDFEYLLFVGSMGSYDRRVRKVTHAFVRLLHEAGVNFAILGDEENGSGDTPRRLGNEMLFQQLAMENIATFQQYGVRKIVTACPHTFNTLKNEYPEFGMEGVEVYHHTQLLAELVKQGKLRPTHRLQERVVYHDACYLGRYNGVFDAPREILEAIPGVELVEMERNRENAMCCGAGGGRMWMEETKGKRINLARTQQALSVHPTVIGSACPYCLTMMEDGTKLTETDDTVKARDVAELLAASVFAEDVRQNKEDEEVGAR
ncbi:Fe-S oxidoreductase [Alicyclobacillus sacchari]|uniref:Fe-S oxidoreductase n=2 Tax=Alicyclobacillus sacchari TaxID=392010 RepID=A0A4R8LVE2_9BACL|nr:Fe-S oxidoreductase [Alicyclobacillus sacchari]